MIHKSEDNYQFPAFIELSSVDSTNNYALSLVRSQNLTERQLEALHGTAVFAHEQYLGKGQRGKTWASASRKNVHLSLIIAPEGILLHRQFVLTALTALVARRFMEEKAGLPCSVKWPNDIYFQDRKAGGILIENIISGTEWKWAVAGIGLNINQTDFDPALPNPVSLKQITGKEFDCVELAKELSRDVFEAVSGYRMQVAGDLLSEYNRRLYKRGEKVKLKKDNRVFEATIKEVAENGQLVVETGMEERFDFGEVSFII